MEHTAVASEHSWQYPLHGITSATGARTCPSMHFPDRYKVCVALKHSYLDHKTSESAASHSIGGGGKVGTDEHSWISIESSYIQNGKPWNCSPHCTVRCESSPLPSTQESEPKLKVCCEGGTKSGEFGSIAMLAFPRASLEPFRFRRTHTHVPRHDSPPRPRYERNW